jgi:hypothetical protein
VPSPGEVFRALEVVATAANRCLRELPGCFLDLRLSAGTDSDLGRVLTVVVRC